MPQVNYAGILMAVFLISYFPACGLLGWWIKRQNPTKAVQIEPILYDRPDPVAPTPVHLHILDLDRSNPTVTEIGGILANCIVAGCGESVYIAPSLAATYVATDAVVRR